MNIEQLHTSQKEYFATGATKNLDHRISGLKKLLKVLEAREQEVYRVLEQDLGKSNFEAFLTEYQVITGELKKYIKNTKKWSQPDRVLPSIFNFPSTAKIHKEPYGNTLIIAPWNYPFQLALGPLIGAVAAGNTVILKPSEFSNHTSRLLESVVSEAFAPDHVAVVCGDAQVAQQLTSLRWDYIFFTGSPQVGKIIYKAAAEHLTPVTLELGGKNPCVVDATADLKVAAKRIVWAKFLNAGQTCIAPDYLLVHKSKKEALIKLLIQEIENFFGRDPQKSDDYPRVIRDQHLKDLVNLLENERIIYGGTHDLDHLYLAPTLLDEPNREAAVMNQEIFGPVLPIISYENRKELAQWIESYEKPLGGYCFTESKEMARWFVDRFSYGGGVINDSIVQFVNERLPFGGVGHSGIGSYHGKKTFDVFSHHKSMVYRRTWLDLTIKYPPYKGKLAKVRRLLKWV
jgi:aldehyde dehydrogenase (NAD+)